MNTQTKKIFGVVPLVIAFLVFAGIYAMFAQNNEVQPKSAKRLTEEQREANDVAVFMSEVSGVEQIEIKYGVDGIKVYLTQKSTDQYVAAKAEAIEDTIVDVIENRRADLTFEKDPTDYFVYVYGSDGRLIYQ
jgi:hypothetical protein